jgi:hypothetical protein
LLRRFFWRNATEKKTCRLSSQRRNRIEADFRTTKRSRHYRVPLASSGFAEIPGGGVANNVKRGQNPLLGLQLHSVISPAVLLSDAPFDP